jgi:diguanylate cyclase (GGDEF)-like protein
MAVPAPSRLRRFVLAVSTAGLCLLAALVILGAADIENAVDRHLLLLALAVLAAELMPIRMPRYQGELTTSTTFAYAVLLLYGLPVVVVVQAVASIVADVAGRKPLTKILYNVAQYTIAWAAAAAALRLMVGHPLMGQESVDQHLLAVLAAGGVFFACNYGLATIPGAITGGTPIRIALARSFTFQGTTAALLIGFAPVVAVAADHDPLLVPLLFLPVLATWRSGVLAARNETQAREDALTGLPNRLAFREQVEDAIGRAAPRGRAAVVVVLDLDRFKEVNDALGHDHGDRLLRGAGERLAGAAGTCTLARLGGDTFAALVPDADGAHEGEALAEALCDALRVPVDVDGVEVELSASAGIAASPEHATDAEALIRRAEVAMYQAKQGIGAPAVYDPAHHRFTAERLAMVGDLRRAIEAGEIEVHYQPLADVRGGEVLAVEALVRWERRGRGIVMPADFVPIAEHTGLIRPLTRLVLERALGQVAAWQREGIELDVSVNLSPRNLMEPGIVEQVAEQLAAAGLEPSRLVLEITETAIMADELRARTVLERLSQMGVGLAVDDFGIGHSSLAYLKRLPVDELKIDRAFVAGLADDRSDAAIVRSTIAIARDLGLRTVAEGVEDQEAWDRLAVLGCDLAQGFLLGRPMPAAELTRWLRARTAEPAAGPAAFRRRLRPAPTVAGPEVAPAVELPPAAELPPGAAQA